MEQSRSESTTTEDPSSHLFGHGRLSYVQIPALDARISADSYRAVFGRSVRGDDGADEIDSGTKMKMPTGNQEIRVVLSPEVVNRLKETIYGNHTLARESLRMIRY